MIRKHVVAAVLRRNFVSYFSSPTGYVFITVFMLLCGAAAFWPDRFFTHNLANLETLNRFFPYLMLFFVPAVAMGLWAEERKQGTDELLLTLPARDIELVLGKYLAALGIHTVSLGFALAYILALEWLGSPDWGVMLGTYLGYWFLGAALLAVASVGSLLTSSMTVAFILGALLCAVPVFFADAGALVGGSAQDGLESLGIARPFQDLAKGVISLKAVVYFVALTAIMLYLNLILLGRRHARSAVHPLARIACLFVAGVSLVVLAGRLGWRVDVTHERLHSLTPATREILSKLDSARPVHIHAYVAPEVPQSYVETRETLLDLLREYQALGGGKIHLKINETRRYSPEAREATQKFDLKAEPIQAFEEGKRRVEHAFLGVALTCGAQETVIPFFHRGLSVEYELTRSIGVVTGARRQRVGIATTDAKMFGGFDFQRMSSEKPWEIIDALKQQYDVVQVGLDQPVTEKCDALLVAMPSSLTQPQMDNLMAWIKKGGPTLLLDDPLPLLNPGLSPREQKQAPGGRGGMFGQPPAGEPKGNIAQFMTTLGVNWPVDDVAWTTYNPHKEMSDLPKIFVFVSPESGTKEAFNPADSISSGLQEMVLLGPGRLLPITGSPLSYTPLLRTSFQSGVVRADEVFQRSFMGMGLNEHIVYRPGGAEHVLAARVQGTLPGETAKTHVVMVADLDFVGDQFFNLREQGSLAFDNVTFILNCVDSLAGDETYVPVRKRRPKHRTLEWFEGLTKGHRDSELEQTQKAEKEAKDKLDDAQKRLDEVVQKIRAKPELDERTRELYIQTAQNVENRKLEMERERVEDEKNRTIELSHARTKEAIDALQRRVRFFAVLLPALPPIAIGLVLLMMRLGRERRVV